MTNPLNHTATSIALLNIALGVEQLTVQVLISEINREAFRHHACVSETVIGAIHGFGVCDMSWH